MGESDWDLPFLATENSALTKSVCCLTKMVIYNPSDRSGGYAIIYNLEYSIIALIRIIVSDEVVLKAIPAEKL